MNRTLFLLFAFLCVCAFPARAQLTITNPTVVTEKRIGRTQFEYTMRANVVNPGVAAAAVSAVVTSTSPHTTVVEGTVSFGNIGAATTATSADTFTIVHNRTVAFNPAVLQWTIKLPFIVSDYLPHTGANEVGVTFRPQVFFSKPVDPTTLNATNFYASFAGQKLAAAIVPSNDGTFAWLFFTDPMPSASQVQVIVDGSTIRLAGGTELLDAAGTGTAGSKLTFNFSTVSIAPVPNTTVSGRIVDPGPDLLPYTDDDSNAGLDGKHMTADDLYFRPLPGVKIFIIGLEGNAVFTDVNGLFTLPSVPSGNVKVVIDGRTSSSVPAGYYFPEMVMDAHMQPGINNFVMMGMETMYLPRIPSSILQNVSASQTTMVTLRPEAALTLPPEQQQYLTVEVQPGSLVNNGQHVANGQVGISVVPPELVRDMLPPGLLQHTFDITVQAPAITNFSTPAPMSAPNVFNASPGTKLNFLSFDHTTGRLVIEGTGTVSADGLSVHTDPGTGITHPGWHGWTPPGAGGRGGGGGPGGDCSQQGVKLISQGLQCALQIGAAGFPVTGCAMSFVTGAAQSAIGCAADPTVTGCGKTIAGNALGSLIGCVPFFGFAKAAGIGYSCLLQGNSAYQEFRNCGAASQPGLAAAALDFGDSPFLQQANLWADTTAIIDAILGTTKWTTIQPAEEPSVKAFLSATLAATNPSSPGGAAILPSERAALLLMPLPGSILVADAEALITRIDKLATERFTAADFDFPAIGAAGQKLLATANDLKAKGWTTSADLFGRWLPEFARTLDTSVAIGSPKGIYYKFTNLAGGFELRGKLASGQRSFDCIFLSANSSFSVEYVVGATKTYGATIFSSGPSGQKFSIPSTTFAQFASDSPDADGDGLPDIAEIVIGTSLTNRDTDGDGISDLAEIQQGLDPLSGLAVATGVIANLPLVGEAKEVVLEGSTTNSAQQAAYIAAGTGGMAIVNASEFQKPVLVSRLGLSGDATDVSVDFNLQIAAVATNSGGFHFVNISDPLNPTLLRTIPVTVNQVEVSDGIAYAGVGFEIHSYNLLSGERLQVLSPGNANFTGLARDGSTLYTVDASRVLRAIDIGGANMIARGSLTMPAGGGKLFVGGGVAYVGTGGGFVTVNVSNPASLQLLSGVDAANIEGTHVVANGSGLAVAVGSVVGPTGPINGLDVLNVSDPANTGAFITRFNLPASPRSIAIGSGIAFVATGTAGLQVVNYRAFDNQGVAPTVTVNTAGMDVDAVKPGIQVVEGSLVSVPVQVSDDVQVRNVELLVNGQVVQNDVSFPFNLTAAMPTLASGATTATVQVRATDTGGNIGLSPLVTLQIVPDTVLPTIVSLDPANGTSVDLVSRTITIQFSEPIDFSTFNASDFSLVGASGVIPLQSFQFGNNGATLRLTFGALALGNYTLTINAAALKDRAGNRVGTAPIVSTFTYIISRQVVSREASIFIENGLTDKQVVSREVSLVVTTPEAPPQVTGILVTPSATGDSVALNWASYNPWAVKDVDHFNIYISDTRFTDVTGMTPYKTVGGETVTATLTGLTTFRDHYIAIVAVDALNPPNPVVVTSAAYLISPQTISREVSFFIGDEPQPLFMQLVSREVSVEVTNAAAGSLSISPWRRSYFNAAELANPALEVSLWGDYADPDLDGVPNLVEYALGGNLRAASSLNSAGSASLLPVQSFTQVGTDYFYDMIYRRRTDAKEAGMDYRPEFSQDLETWFPANTPGQDWTSGTTIPAPLDPSMSEFENVTLRLSTPIRLLPSRFFSRLRIIVGESPASPP